MYISQYYDQEKGCKWSTQQLRKYLSAKHGMEAVSVTLLALCVLEENCGIGDNLRAPITISYYLFTKCTYKILSNDTRVSDLDHDLDLDFEIFIILDCAVSIYR